MTNPDTKPNDEAAIEGDNASAVDAAFNHEDDQLSQLQSELKAADERVLRAQAELENYRKRIRREMEDDRKYAALPLVRDLLPVLDNLERAIDAAAGKAEASGLLDGVKLVKGQLENVLAQHHAVRIATVGTTFDPNLHQAIAQEASTEHAAGTITRAAQAGYSLYDRVVRPAQVMVSTGPPQ